MPSEHLPSQSQTRPALDGRRSTSSINSQTESPSTSPPQHGKPKHQKHVVGGRGHARIPSSKALHKLTKPHGNEGSHTDLKKLAKNSSATSLKKNSSHVSLKRNRSSADVSKRPKSSQGQPKRPASVHFEIGDGEQEDQWEEASSSASPNLSRSASRSAVSSGQLSAIPSANNSQPQSRPQSPPRSPSKTQTASANGSSEFQSVRHNADAKAITERLLQRTPSHNTTKMSLATATPSGHSSSSPEKSQGSPLIITPKSGSNTEVVSRFVGDSGTPSENSPFLHSRRSDGQHPKQVVEEVKRAQSMGNIAHHGSDGDDGEESALAPRSRKSSASHAYVPPQQSRTQQKLWLQRASSNIEPQQMAPGVAMNGLTGLHGGLGGTALVGAGYDGRDPRIKLQLERTGLEYLVVRRHQDPVGLAIKRLNQLPGAEKNRRIPSQKSRKPDGPNASSGRHGLSQSLKETRRGGTKSPGTAGARASYEGQSGSQDDTGVSDRGHDDEGVGAILRSMWDKNFDFSASAD